MIELAFKSNLLDEATLLETLRLGSDSFEIVYLQNKQVSNNRDLFTEPTVVVAMIGATALLIKTCIEPILSDILVTRQKKLLSSKITIEVKFGEAQIIIEKAFPMAGDMKQGIREIIDELNSLPDSSKIALGLSVEK